MKKKVLLIAIILASALAAHGQQTEWKSIYSDEFHIMANFPGDSKESTRTLEFSFGGADAKRWSLELPGITYEVLLADFPDLSVKGDAKSLRKFYRSVCYEIGGDEECQSGSGSIQFNVDESGFLGGFRTRDTDVSFSMFVIGKRFYMARVAGKMSDKAEIRKDVNKFLDSFLFCHLTENKEFIWGLPQGYHDVVTPAPAPKNQ